MRTYIVVDDIDEHEREEADEEGDEDGQHHLGEPQVLLSLGGGQAALLVGGGRGVLRHVQPGLPHAVEYGWKHPSTSMAGSVIAPLI